MAVQHQVYVSTMMYTIIIKVFYIYYLAATNS